MYVGELFRSRLNKIPMTDFVISTRLAKRWRWVARLKRGVDTLERWMAKLVARLLAPVALWVRIQTYH
jgi:hypothetical protein